MSEESQRLRDLMNSLPTHHPERLGLRRSIEFIEAGPLHLSLPETAEHAEAHLAHEHGAGVPQEEALATHYDLHNPAHPAYARNRPDHLHDFKVEQAIPLTYTPMPNERLYSDAQVNSALFDAIEELPLLGLLTEPGKRAIRTAINSKLRSLPVPITAANGEKDWQNLSAERKVEIIEAMGFTPHRDNHQPDCPGRMSGFICNCVPDSTEWAGPLDVEVFRHETWEERRDMRRRQIEAQERKDANA